MQQLLLNLWAFVWTPDFAGLVCGVAGTLLLAMKGRWAGWGFVAYLASNVGWLYHAHATGQPKLLTQHAIFAVSSLVGVWVWLVRDRMAAALDRLFFFEVQDTLQMEDEIWHRFTGRNAKQLAAEYGITPGEVFDIVITREPASTRAMAARYNRDGRRALERI